MLFDLVDLFLIHKEEVGHFAKTRHLCSKREVMDMLQRVIKPRSFVSTIFEVPKVIKCVPRVFSLIMVRDCIQWSPILTVVSWNDAYNMRVGAHDDPSVASWDASPFAVSDNTGDKVDPAVEVES